MDKVVGVIALSLNGVFFWLLFGPKSGEGMVYGWGNAFGMLIIIAVLLVMFGAMVLRAVIRRRALAGLEIAAMTLCALPACYWALFNFFR